MKIIKYFIFTLGSIFIMNGVVNAESIKLGNFINGEYLRMIDSNNKSSYLTLQFITDNNGNIVYCIEPFKLVNENSSYKPITGDLISYNELNDIQKRKVSLLAYYGYGYGNRTSKKWYVITQVLIWKIVSPNSKFYYTDYLNGNNISKYDEEIKEILNDIANHDKVPSFVKDYYVDYKGDLLIEDLNNDYELLKSSYVYDDSFGFKINDVTSDGDVYFKKLSNIYKDRVVIFDSNNSQDVIRPGNVDNKEYKLDIKVLKGHIILDIRKDTSVYSVESDFSNTCYHISKGDTLMDSVCSDNEGIVYKSIDLGYGDYTIKQVSVGEGYRLDSNTYDVKISNIDNNPNIILYNKLIRNKIEIDKYACIDLDCSYENNAKFIILDKNNDVVSEIVTDNNGYAYLEVGYGSYTIRQIDGIDNYTYVEDYGVKIVDEVSTHRKNLYNYSMDIEVKGETEVLPPLTYVYNESILKMLYNIFESIINLFLKFVKYLL